MKTKQKRISLQLSIGLLVAFQQLLESFDNGLKEQHVTFIIVRCNVIEVVHLSGVISSGAERHNTHSLSRFISTLSILLFTKLGWPNMQFSACESEQ